MHSRIIEFDKHLRACAANRSNLELTDVTDVDFSGLKEQFLNLQGRGDGSGGGVSGLRAKAKSGIAGGTSGTKRARSQEPCGRCNDNHPHNAESCIYVHVCALCHGPHAKGKCTKNVKA